MSKPINIACYNKTWEELVDAVVNQRDGAIIFFATELVDEWMYLMEGENPEDGRLRNALKVLSEYHQKEQA